MDARQLAAINRERLTQWQQDLQGFHATGAILIGCGHDAERGTMHVFGPEDWAPEQVVLMLLKAAQLLSQGNDAPPDEAAGNLPFGWN